MIKWGISAQSHDAALAVMVDDQLVYASHGERYSRVKNDRDLHPDQITEALQYGEPDRLFYYERPLMKKWRQLCAGQYDLLLKQGPRSYMREFGIRAPMTMTDHHHSHAAYGYYTSPYDYADVLVIDSIGEFTTTSLWQGEGDKLTKIKTQSYPDSIGLWYSAMTQRLGLKPQEHEYILMGMAAYGDPKKYKAEILQDFFVQLPSEHTFDVTFTHNLHRGCQWWRPDLNTVQDFTDIAAAVQEIYVDIFRQLLIYIRRGSMSSNLVVVGGCALNCVANTHAFAYYQNVWIPANPGDAGSSVGAILANNPQHIGMPTANLGTDIPGDYPVDDIIQDLLTTGVSAVAAGRAEFGPRALGNRSILADPRIIGVKDKVNALKHREEFRPFAPAVLRSHAHKYFTTPIIQPGLNSPFMQYAWPCIAPDKFPGIVHVDNTSRVQTVANDNSGFRRLLDAWYAKTGCPMLLNTSLNIKGEPLVNTREDAERWSQQYGVQVRTPQ
jgi:carbamoyltransferase